MIEEAQKTTKKSPNIDEERKQFASLGVKPNSTLKLLTIIIFAFLLLLISLSYFISGAFSMDEKEEDPKRIARQGHLVKPTFDTPKINNEAFTNSDLEPDPLNATAQTNESKNYPKINEYLANTEEKGMFDDLIPELKTTSLKDKTYPSVQEEVIFRPGNEENMEVELAENKKNAEQKRLKDEQKRNQEREKKKRQHTSMIFAPFKEKSSLEVNDDDSLDEKTSLKMRLRSTSLEQVKAGKMTDITYTITSGTIIPCVLNSKIDSNLPGFIRCTVTDNVYGFDGRKVLIPKGTFAYGEYNEGINLGIDRLFVTWSKLRTQDGVVVDINSPGTGSLGESGVGGKIDSRWFRRFGGAILLSLVNDAASSAGESSFKEARNSLHDSTKEIISQYADIPPVLFKSQGDITLIYVARDISFQSIYKKDI